ncbi:MAG TPA: LON peptidase substrate-binding domain-containing protein [Tepidiformaceae bacterium]|nr:LON peptidase substrate-binding domain-containing protein [Tepidiformaceae bacterium]
MEIPLFPLRTVLFPGMPLPLQIFEERYRVMTRELLASGAEFGVLLIREGKEVGGGAIPFEVGTTARIEECEELPGGRFAMTARGMRRFRLVQMLPARPYPFGRVELMDDAEVLTPQALRASETVRATFPLYFRLALSLTDQWAQGMKLPERPHALVNFLAPWLQIDEEAKQRLLEVEAPADRVAHLAELLDDLLARTREEVVEYRRRKFAGIGSGN